jgi:VanZ family protein
MLAALSVILYASFYPFTFLPERWGGQLPRWSPVRLNSDWADVAINVLLFFPLGWALGGGRGKWRAALVALAAGAITGLAVEMAQTMVPGRVSSLRDVICNAAGAAGGSLAGRFRVPVHAVPIPLLGLWVTWLAFPFVPALRFYKLWQGWENLLNELLHPRIPFPWTGDLILGTAAVAGAGGRLPRAGLLAFLAGVVAWRGLLPGQRFSPGELLAVAAGWALARIGGGHPRLASWIWLAWIVQRQLWPFGWSGGSALEWRPFHGAFQLTAPLLVTTMAGKTLIYAGALTAWRTAGWPGSAWSLAALLGFTEWLQCFLPGRQPEPATEWILLLAALAMIRYNNPSAAFSWKRTASRM